MADHSNIAWTDATQNFWIGCTRVSPACDRCYAAEWAARYEKEVTWGEPGQKSKLRRTSTENWKKPLVWNRKAEKEGKRLKVFCSSLSDFFDNPASVHFFSCEPLLGSIDLSHESPHGDWYIVGGESGQGFRAMDMRAVEHLRSQCANRNIAFFFKQDSSLKPGCKGRASDSLWRARYFPERAA